MSLEIVRDNLDGLDDSLKGLYKENEGKFQLDIDLNGYVPEDSVSGLKANHDKLLAEKKQAQERARQAAEEAARIAEENAKKNGDLESLTKSWTEKEKTYQEQINALEGERQNRIKDSAANDLATKLADGANAKLLKTFISQRLKVEGDEVKVLDQNGKPTISTLEDLQKEFESNADFDSLLRGSKASGSGASKSNEGRAGATEIKRSDFDQLNQAERREFFKSGGRVTD